MWEQIRQQEESTAFSLRLLKTCELPILKGDNLPQGKEPVIGLRVRDKGMIRWDFCPILRQRPNWRVLSWSLVRWTELTLISIQGHWLDKITSFVFTKIEWLQTEPKPTKLLRELCFQRISVYWTKVHTYSFLQLFFFQLAMSQGEFHISVYELNNPL